MHNGDILIAELLDITRGDNALLIITGTCSEEIIEPFFRKADAGRTCAYLQNFRFVINILGSFRHGGTIRADYGDNFIGSQFLRG